MGDVTEQLQDLCAEFGCPAGVDRIDFLRLKLTQSASPSGFNDGVRAAGAEDLLRDAGIDGVKWAAAFKATAESLGHHGMDEGWLIGWFCNAIMAGYDEAAFRSRAAYGE